MTYKITVTRVYEVPEEIVLERLDNDEELISSQDEKDLKKRIAEEIVKDWLYDEMPEIIDNPSDFFSFKIETK